LEDKKESKMYRRLFDELGLSNLPSIDSIEARISEVNMRQLDRLKLMLGRVDAQNHIFSIRMRKGIRSNEFASFAGAVEMLNSLDG